MLDSSATTVGLLLADSRLPSGGHVSSSGLEPALMGGLALAEVPRFLASRVRTVASTDAATAALSRHLVVSSPPDSGAPQDQLHEVERAWAARTPSPSQRRVATELGRGLLRLAQTVWPQSATLAGLSSAPRPIALGAIAAHTHMDAVALVRLTIYDDIASAASALLKLEPGDPAEATRMVLEVCAEAENQIVPAAAACTSTHLIPATSAPELEQWTEHHATTPRRLFRA